ncbi:hypothetical protein, partial [Acidiphilium sp.]|uniref:hypothetical protein n=1 Tax=Acidiphilium sp. TaxID=527 RepID=UPI003CFDE909
IYAILSSIESIGLIRSHTVKISPTHNQILWSLTEQGMSAYRGRSRLFRSSDFSPTKYVHRILLQALRISAEAAGFEWWREPILDQDDPTFPRPDARLKRKNKYALELELTPKTAVKYQSVLSAHDRAIYHGYYSRVLYCVQHPPLARFLERQFIGMDDPSRYAVVVLPPISSSAADWPGADFWDHLTAPVRQTDPPPAPPQSPNRPAPVVSRPRPTPVILLRDGYKIVFSATPLHKPEVFIVTGLLRPDGARVEPPESWAQYRVDEDDTWKLPIAYVIATIVRHGNISPDSAWTIDSLSEAFSV